MGMFLIMFMPLRLGELARPYLMKRELAIPLTSGLGAAALERALDGLCVALFFLWGFGRWTEPLTCLHYFTKRAG